MQRSDFFKLGLVLALSLAAACGPARPGGDQAGQTPPAVQVQSAQTVPAGGPSPAAVASPGVLTALPALPTATAGSGPAGLPAVDITQPAAGGVPPAASPVQPGVPPAAAASPPPTQPAPALPTPTLTCDNGLRYLSDLTIPDGTLVSPGDALDKRWQVENSGTCNWNDGYRLRRISGDPLGAPDELALYPARSGTQAVIRIVFIAPQEPGTYRSAWQAYNAQGEAFGDPVFVEIIVGSGSP